MNTTLGTVLIIDDIPLNISLLAAMLRNAGYQVISALSGREGRLLALKEQPDIILLDITMPGEDGITTCRILKADPRTTDIPVIFISAVDSIDIKVSGFTNGAVDFVTKPFERAEVIARVALHLKLRDRYVAAVRKEHTILDKLQSAQHGMLVKPDDMPDAAFAVSYRAVHAAGGDFYDVCRMKDDSFAYFIADISGHDLDVSFNTSAIKALFHQAVQGNNSSTDIVCSINRGIIPLFYCNGMHMTASFINLDRSAGMATLVNAGHLPVIHLSVDGSATLLEAEGDILGVFEELVLHPLTTQVKKGDRLFIYTDGLVEQNSESMDRMEGISKLTTLCQETAYLPLVTAVSTICSRSFPADVVPGDDIILLGVEV